ncbi:MAG: phosphoribosylformylglycinamidine synthase subunit PurQ [Pseudomonadota bacterium]
MKTGVIVFPGSNCDRDMAVALAKATGHAPAMVWHKESALPDGLDLVAIPGGFSFGDYLRCGAIAAHAPIMQAVRAFAERGGLILGVCNGWQVLIEAGLLPGALMRNAGLKFVCRDVHLTCETASSAFTGALREGQVIRVPVAHHDGCFVGGDDLLDRLEGEGRVAFRYTGSDGRPGPRTNPNGAMRDISGVLSENRRVLGMMPHPERMADPALGGADRCADGRLVFQGLADALQES